MKDDNGVVQLWLVSPNGGAPQQLTTGEQGIQSAFSWDPQGDQLAFVCDNSIMLCNAISGKKRRITARTDRPPLSRRR